MKSTKLRYICSRFQVPLPPPPWSWSPASPPLWCGVVVVPWFPLVVRWWFIGLACGLYPLGYLCRPYHGGGASEPGTGITYIYIYISAPCFLHGVVLPKHQQPQLIFFRVKCNVPTSTLSSEALSTRLALSSTIFKIHNLQQRSFSSNS